MRVIVFTIDIRYATLFWILPTPDILAVGFDLELSPLISNCDSMRFIF